MSPMCMYSAADQGPDTGVPTDFHFTHLTSRAAGGAGLVMAEATSVSARGAISAWDLRLYNDRQQEAFARITAAIKAHGSVPAIQLAHAGRKASTDRPWLGGGFIPESEGGWETIAPSGVPFGDRPVPHELTVDEIHEAVAEFRAAAVRALAAGFEVVEVHGAHGYLINQFLSPLANLRTDEYGGSFENRLRFPLQVVDAIREVWPEELPVFFRTSATDWLAEDPEDPREGWTVDDTVRLAKELQAHGVDLLDVSTGGIVPDAKVPAGPGYQVPFAAQAREQAGIATSSVGRITEPKQAEEIIASGQADAVMLGRQLLRDPYWALHAAAELGDEQRWPLQYGYAFNRKN
jgi:2,4-dienoyl-CoA reductase-like NADH-dependent reductase (Old Yellow Enzyme family)